MATAKNKLPQFGESATLDNNIVDNSSTLKTTGFQPNTTIQSAQVNTYMKMLVNGMNGLVDSLYREAIAQGEISATSKASDWQDYLLKGLTNLIENTKVKNADTATSTSGNSATASKLQTSRKISIVGDASGNTTFDGSKDVSITVDVSKAGSLDSTNIGDDKNPVYFNDLGKPVATGETLSKNVSGNAATASKLMTARTINLKGDITGTASFDGSKDIDITTTKVNKKATKLVDSIDAALNVGSSSRPVYFVDGIPSAITNLSTSLVFGTPSTEPKFTVEKLLTMWSTASNTFIADASKVLTNESGTPLTFGSTHQPVYFNEGKPVACKITHNKVLATKVASIPAAKLFDSAGVKNWSKITINALLGGNQLSKGLWSFSGTAQDGSYLAVGIMYITNVTKVSSIIADITCYVSGDVINSSSGNYDFTRLDNALTLTTLGE